MGLWPSPVTDQRWWVFCLLGKEKLDSEAGGFCRAKIFMRQPDEELRRKPKFVSQNKDLKQIFKIGMRKTVHIQEF